jgi:hypothetical protein
MRLRAAFALIISAFVIFANRPARAQQQDAATIIHDLDSANQSRFDNVLQFSDTEHYRVYRGKDQTLVAEMTVRVTYKKGVGKSYRILSQSGSSLIQKHGLQPLLDNEKAINDPAKAAQSWFTSANYKMKLKPGVTRVIDGHDCIAIAISPRRQAPNMLEGTLWVDAHTHMQIEVDGIASKSPSIFAGTTKMMRRYADMHGYAMATHASAESSSFFFGRTVVTIDYSDYEFEMRNEKQHSSKPEDKISQSFFNPVR